MLRALTSLLVLLVLPACDAAAPDDPVPPRTRSAAPEAPGVRPEPSPGGEPVAAPDADDVLWVDVRTPEEFAAGHVRGALNIPHDQLASRWRELQGHRHRKVALYCRTGRRSGIALRILRSRGFENAVDVGGLAALRAEGIPVGVGNGPGPR